jgi:dephospho-CoA kinase
MMKIGLTGGIGSGKSLVASVFEKLGVPVYQADIEAKKFLFRKEVIAQLTNRFSETILLTDGGINRKALAEVVFHDTSALNVLNGIIHPLVKIDFDEWCKLKSDSNYIIQEAAILFESGFDKMMDRTIVVHAPREVCIKRVMQRDKVEAGQVIQRMNHQWEPELLIKKADYIIQNDDYQPLLPQILSLKKNLDQEAKGF